MQLRSELIDILSSALYKYDVVSQRTDWKTIQTPFMFQKGQKPDKVTLNLVINGKGIVWIDDVVLAKELLK